MKSYMKRRVIMLIGIMMLVAVVGVGFAAWVITAPTEDATSNGNIEVEQVTEQTSWSFGAYWVNSAQYQPVESGEDGGKLTGNPTVVFGTPKDTIEDAWLENSEIGEESLKVYLYVKAIAGDDAEAINEASGSVSLYALVPSENEDEEAVATDLNTYLGKFASVSVSDTELDSNELVQGVVLTIEFKWNTFTSKTEVIDESQTNATEYEYTHVESNPYTYYNSAKYSVELANLANEYLTGLYNLLSGIEFQVLLQAQ